MLKIEVFVWFKDTHREKALSNKTQAPTKIMNMEIWVVGVQMNSLWEVPKLKQNFHRNKIVTCKTPFFVIGLFCTHHSNVLKLASDMAVLSGNDAFSILVLSTKRWYSSFLKKSFVFQKICFKVKVLKTFKTFTDCRIKTCRSLKGRAILKIPSTVFWKNCSFCWL